MYWIFFLTIAGRLTGSIVEVGVLGAPKLEYDKEGIAFPGLHNVG